MRNNVIWAFVSNGANAIFSWFMLLTLTKIGSSSEVGLFALAQAVALPVHMFFSFKMRTVQSTDHKNEFTENEYKTFSKLSAVASFLTTALVASFFYQGEKYTLILVLAFSYSFVIYREFYLSWLQKFEMNKSIAYSNVLHGGLTFILFVVGYLSTKTLWAGVVGILLAKATLTMLFDAGVYRNRKKDLEKNKLVEKIKIYSKIRKQYGLLRIGLPLGITALLTTSFTSIPRIVLERFCTADIVGYYAALASLLVIVNLFVVSIGQSILPRLSVYHIENRRLFLRYFYVFFILTIVFVVSLIIASYFFSPMILTLLFTEKYASYSATFSKLMIAGGGMAFFSLMNIAISAQRNFFVQLPIYLVCAGVTLSTSYVLIPQYGIDGAAYSYGICNWLGFAMCSYVFVREEFRRKRIENK